MKITSDTSLRYFEFWSGAKDTADLLTLEELDTIESQLEELYPDGMTDTEINDLFWFDTDFISEMVGRDIYAEDEEDEDEEEQDEDED